MKSQSIFMKQSLGKNDVNGASRQPGKLAQLAFHSLNLHIVEKGAAEAADQHARRLYEREAEEIKQEMRAVTEREAQGLKSAAKAAKAVKGSRKSALSKSVGAYSSRRSQRRTIGSARKMAAKASARRAVAKKK
jgi:hypothetical protein